MSKTTKRIRLCLLALEAIVRIEKKLDLILKGQQLAGVAEALKRQEDNETIGD